MLLYFSLTVFIISLFEIHCLGPLILKSDWLFFGQYFPVFRPVSISFPILFTNFAFHMVVIL